MKNIQALLIFIFFLLFSNKKRFPKLPGFVGKCCQIFGIFSLLIPKAYLMSLIVGNDSCTLAFGGLYLLEFIVMICFNKIFWGSFGGKHIHCRVFKVVADHDKLLTQWRYINISKFFIYLFPMFVAKYVYYSPIFLLIQIQLVWLLIGSLAGLLLGKSYDAKLKMVIVCHVMIQLIIT